MARVDFKLDDINLRKNIAEVGPKVNKYITLTTDFGATQAVKDMKQKAPWTDRTSAARNGLNASADHTGTGPIGFSKHTVTMSHGVDYGIWLEIANSGKFQIIMPTVLAIGKEIMKTLEGLFDNLDGAPSVRSVVDMPNVGRRGTSQGARQRAERHARQARTQRSGTTRRTRRT